jgi:site-specific DNA-methyltransferase (adenine-specific)
MIPTLTIGDATIYQGNNLHILPELPDNSVDAIVCDPPYELGFMGKSWDSSGIAYSVELWRECLRVLKPGGHLLAFGGTRTWHRLAVAIEDAGFEIRDNIAWLYGSGFPKSHNISKAIDKAAGVEFQAKPASGVGFMNNTDDGYNTTLNQLTRTGESTDEAKLWNGWGTALKPAHEPIVVARKAVEGTVANNVLTWGVGGLNIDASRVGTEVISVHNAPKGTFAGGDAERGSDTDSYRQHEGRWPANIILDEYTAELLDEQSDASKFFYVAKASKRDRNEGLDELPIQRPDLRTSTGMGTFEEKGVQPQRNFHPTVKPTALMQYLIRLVTPDNGVVLDPFAGSGSTGKAAILENKKFIGIELTAEYLPIIEGRLKHAQETKSVEEGDLFE